MKKVMLAFGISLCLSVILSSFTEFSEECKEIRENVLRIHVVANSDSDEDQSLKLAVRDEILSEASNLFYSADSAITNKDQAVENVKLQLGEIRNLAQEYVYSQGFDYEVEVLLTNMFFATTEYENFVMPAGHYDALRVNIGKSSGENWWCVLYPALCVPAVSEEKSWEESFTDTQSQIIENSDEYEVEFAFLEIFERIKIFFE